MQDCTSYKIIAVVTLAAKDNVNFPKQLNDGFKRSIYWNEYKSENNNHNQNLLIPKLAGPLMKVAMLLAKNVLAPRIKSVRLYYVWLFLYKIY